MRKTTTLSIMLLPVLLGTPLVGLGQQVCDSTRTCGDGNWSETSCWDGLCGGDPYPNNSNLFICNAYLPPATSPGYAVMAGVGRITLTSLTLQASGDGQDAARLYLASTDFDPGELTNYGWIELLNDELILTGDVLNNGTITFEDDTGSEYIRAPGNLKLAGTGRVVFPDINSTSTSCHRIDPSRDVVFTDGNEHRIEGEPEKIYYSSCYGTGQLIGARSSGMRT